MRCSICGKEVSAGEGYETSIGFVCLDCYRARGFQFCAECGRRFPRDEMIEWNGLFYCRNDYFTVKNRYERILEEEKRKKEEEREKKRPPIQRSAGAIGAVGKRRKGLSDGEIRALTGNLREKELKPVYKGELGIQERKEEKKKELSKDEKQKEISKLLSQLNSKTSKQSDFEVSKQTDLIGKIEEVILSSLGDISLSEDSKKKRLKESDAISAAIKEINEIIRVKKR
jgi:DNA-directed RNA polymerase subunit RPC12/RpoP